MCKRDTLATLVKFHRKTQMANYLSINSVGNTMPFMLHSWIHKEQMFNTYINEK